MGTALTCGTPGPGRLVEDTEPRTPSVRLGKVRGGGHVRAEVPEAVRTYAQTASGEWRHADDAAEVLEGLRLGVFRLLATVLGVDDDVPEGAHGTVASVACLVIARSLHGRQRSED